MADFQRVEIGFQGGQVISARVGEEALRALRAKLADGGWHDLETEDGVMALYLGSIAFVRVDSGEHKVGFVFGQ